ncbi:TatD family hydrolase [Thioalkalivibrio paradoxus]|uniref:Preprotein translocase subunit TatD n=1 Tax=Thioalkalivibrio paradoxus ARh 1 TaxID=713585 RepID=W0DQ21_9GAMM|nr:TatD family hydrolase [Thioalkalivibrio paradoxus]AHE99342.1 preprotein translocase subunit TatD [Thioalkalivibrio paradoxus ARh 1]
MEWIDICVNLTHESFKRDRAAVIERAAEAGVRWLLVTGADETESRRCVELAEQYPERMRATLGVHPHHASQWRDQTAYRFEEDASHPLVVAMGEMGLDYYRNHSTPAQQRRAFEAQLELAVDLGFPVFLHEREASREFGDILQRYRDRLPAAVVHCFTSDAAALERYLEMDCHIGITGWVCDERRGQDLQQLVPRIPEHRLLLETDAPYLLPRTLPKGLPHGRRNEPSFLPHVGEHVARLREIAPPMLAAQTSANARAFYGLPNGASEQQSTG